MSLLFYGHQAVIAKNYSWSRVLKGDFLFQLAYAIWCYAFGMTYFMYYIPLLLGDVGRLHVMTAQMTGENSTVSHELIIFQNQSEIYILLTLLL